MTRESNYVSLTPQSFLRRSNKVYPDKIAIIDDEKQFTYAEFYRRCCRFANALISCGIQTEENIALLAPNTHQHLEATFGVPMAGGLHARQTIVLGSDGTIRRIFRKVDVAIHAREVIEALGLTR